MISTLNTMINETFTTYKGCLITRISSIQYRVFDNFFSSIEDAKTFIDKPKSLNIINPHCNCKNYTLEEIFYLQMNVNKCPRCKNNLL